MCVFFTAMATISKWCPVWLTHAAVLAIKKMLDFVTKGMFQPMQQF